MGTMPPFLCPCYSPGVAFTPSLSCLLSINSTVMSPIAMIPEASRPAAVGYAVLRRTAESAVRSAGSQRRKGYPPLQRLPRAHQAETGRIPFPNTDQVAAHGAFKRRDPNDLYVRRGTSGRTVRHGRGQSAGYALSRITRTGGFHR